MSDNGLVMMIVCWKQQRRPIEIKINDDVNEIKSACINTFELQQINDLNEYQIQYYDSDHQLFFDLYPGTFHSFQQLLHKLLLPDAPLKSAKEWRLKIVFKISITIRSTVRDDTYNYQQENDITELEPTDGTVSLANNQTNGTRSSSRPGESMTISTENLPMVSTSQTFDEDEREASGSVTNSQSKVPQLAIRADNPYGFGFDRPLANNQRAQFEGEMLRTNKSKTTLGGVLLRALNTSDSGLNDETSYPAVHFQIPSTDEPGLHWCLYVYILTESDINNNHYLHASKGIFNHITKSEERSDAIANTELVNPYIVQLTPIDFRDEKYVLRLKVCNIRNVVTHKHQRLRQFPQLNSTINPDDQTLLSTKSSNDLHFSHEKYHIGCLLVYDTRVMAQCISNLTTAESKRPRSDRPKQQDNKRNRK